MTKVQNIRITVSLVTFLISLSATIYFLIQYIETGKEIDMLKTDLEKEMYPSSYHQFKQEQPKQQMQQQYQEQSKESDIQQYGQLQQQQEQEQQTDGQIYFQELERVLNVSNESKWSKN